MGVSINYPYELPSLNDPATFNPRALQLFAWICGGGSSQLLGQLADMDAADFFSIIQGAGDSTAGRVMTTGAGGVLGRAPLPDIVGNDFDDMLIGGDWTISGDWINGPGNDGVTPEPYSSTLSVVRRTFDAGAAVTQTLSRSGGYRDIWERVGNGAVPVVFDEWRRPGYDAYGLATSFRAEAVSLADDAVFTTTAPRAGHLLSMIVYNNGLGAFPTMSASALLRADSGSTPEYTSIDVGSAVDVSTGVVHSGTTGADGRITIALPGDGTIQVENRMGNARGIVLGLY